MLRISDMKIEVISSVLQYAEEKLEQDLQYESKRVDFIQQKSKTEAEERAKKEAEEEQRRKEQLEYQTKQLQIEEENRQRVAELAYQNIELTKKPEKKSKGGSRKKDTQFDVESGDAEQNLNYHRQLDNEQLLLEGSDSDDKEDFEPPLEDDDDEGDLQGIDDEVPDENPEMLKKTKKKKRDKKKHKIPLESPKKVVEDEVSAPKRGPLKKRRKLINDESD